MTICKKGCGTQFWKFWSLQKCHLHYVNFWVLE